MIHFNKPYVIGTEKEHITIALSEGKFAGDGKYSKMCTDHLKSYLRKDNLSVLLTPSCTAALEMSAILANIQPGDEIIMPSFTFVSTANAFVLRGGVPVFVDIRPDTLNINEKLIESAITSKTKAIVPVHYAGVSCEMNTIMEIAKRHKLLVIEDAAQALGSSYSGQKLGTIGDFGTFSFHETKNIQCGEGGALAINNSEYSQRGEILRDKGTDRSAFFKGQVDKYSWVDVGSSYLPNELTAAFLFDQLLNIDKINSQRGTIWAKYHSEFSQFFPNENLQLPFIPSGIEHNAHIYYIIPKGNTEQKRILESLENLGVQCAFHYVPLHSSKAGQKFCRLGSEMKITDEVSKNLIRLPLYPDLKQSEVNYILETIKKIEQLK